MNTLTYLVLFTAASFLYYGSACLISPRLKIEFERFGLRSYRKLTGILQLLGACGLILGLILPLVGILAAAGLTLLMMAGFITRLIIRDSFLETFPSFFFMILNGYITFSFYVLF
jgi:hypothetical protein